ncbi:MAG: AAA family ATPase, partial [Coriobacteriales bacterium]
MYLKSLVLKGFKSFADRSVLALEPGLTVVVGPNGSGKSNISDSILWVLGEQSAKHLRGQSMQDVIFSGSSARKAVSVAEVSLVLDNADHKVPLEYDEIAITRRMYRSGESEYLVNGAPALLRDIQDILHDSGLGRNTSSIISQGTLSDVLDARDEDRRALIEEAAGILKHKRRKERSARRIESMDASLTRVKDVMKEIDRQLRPLERQARRARQYTAFEGELRQLELSLATDDLRDLQARWDDCVKREKELQAQVDIAQSHLDDRDAELEKYQHILQERGLYVGDLAEQRRRCQSVIERLDASMLLLGEKGNTMVSRTSELRSTIHRSRSRLRDAAEELEPLRRERAAARQRLDALVAELAKLDERGAELAAERKRSDAVFEQLSSELRSAQRGIGECNAQIERYRSSAASLSAEDDLLASRLDQISDLVASDTLALDKMRSRLAELETHAQESACEHDKVRESIESQDRTLGEQRLSHEREQEHHADVVAELRGIEEVDHMLELSDPMRSWLHEHEDEIPGGIRPVCDLFTAPEDCQTLVERLLGADIFGLLVDDVDVATQIARRLLAQTDAEGQVSLFPLDLARRHGGDADPVGERLVDRLSFADEARPAIYALLGDVRLVSDLDEAAWALRRNATPCRYLTSDGVVVWPNGKISLGAREDDAEGVLARKERRETLRRELSDSDEVLAEGAKRLATLQDALSATRRRDVELSQSEASLRGDLDSLRSSIARGEQTLSRAQAEHDSIVSKRAELASRRRQAQPLEQEARSRIEKLKRQVGELEEKLAAGSDERHLRLEQEKTLRTRLSEVEVEKATLETRM